MRALQQAQGARGQWDRALIINDGICGHDTGIRQAMRQVSGTVFSAQMQEWAGRAQCNHPGQQSGDIPCDYNRL